MTNMPMIGTFKD